jgi:hypothetical protein
VLLEAEESRSLQPRDAPRGRWWMGACASSGIRHARGESWVCSIDMDAGVVKQEILLCGNYGRRAYLSSWPWCTGAPRREPEVNAPRMAAAGNVVMPGALIVVRERSGVAVRRGTWNVDGVNGRLGRRVSVKAVTGSVGGLLSDGGAPYSSRSRAHCAGRSPVIVCPDNGRFRGAVLPIIECCRAECTS